MRVLLWAMVVLGIPASAISLAWWTRDLVRWVRRIRARDKPRSSNTSGSGAQAGSSVRSGTPRGGVR